ncbi:uncharacterized protein LOC142099864 isoform X2 [Mixophyes fleayi]|uniref:uncharacterized protein LOC142099864 isoform X2 n=1 Tax=Mixophyes fleayi TaxID=3061075 RepID=UPI003F4E3775
MSSIRHLWIFTFLALTEVIVLNVTAEYGHYSKNYCGPDTGDTDVEYSDFTEQGVISPVPPPKTDAALTVETIPDIGNLWETEIKVIQKRSTAAYNVAQSGKASQSSTKERAANYTTDGQISSKCASTEVEYEPWWTLDLRSNHIIFSVAVTNRRDCCAQDLNGAEIHIGNKEDWRDNPSCGSVSSMGLGETYSFTCQGMPGRLLTIAVPGKNVSLSLCEVQVFGVPENTSKNETWDTSQMHHNSNHGAPNVAQQGNASQSSDYSSSCPAERAIDGSLENHYAKCTHTNNDLEPWWTLDLRSTMKIVSIAVTIRGDCCGSRNKGAEIRVGNSKEIKSNPRCAVITSIDQGKTLSVNCHGLEGQYVSVIIPGREEYLSLCEVQVFALPCDKPDTGIEMPTQLPATEEPKGRTTFKVRKDLSKPQISRKIVLMNVYQSSTHGKGLAKNAIDGLLAHQDPQSQCAVTEEQYEPWWTVELKSICNIHSVALTNRGDCCPSGLDGAEIRVGHDASDWKNNIICGTVSSVGLGETFSFRCDWMEGRFITIVIPDKNASLTLCEVQVFGLQTRMSSRKTWNGDVELQKKNHGAPNVAPRGFTSQSSYFENKYAELAVDGKMFTNYYSGSCTHTLYDWSPWWRVDLESRMQIFSVAITSRGDCCSYNLNEADIRVGDSEERGSSDNPRCTTIINIGGGYTDSYECYGMEGRFVSVNIPDRGEYLTLCEVQVFAKPIGDKKIEMYHNVALTGIATQSSTFSSSGDARHANDGSLANNHIMSQCSITQRDLSPWWMVDLQSAYKVFSVVITNRVLECCKDRIIGAEIRIGSSPENGGTLNPRCGVISSMESGESLFFSCNGMVGQYVTVTVPGREEHLILCEVQVFGVPDTSNGHVIDVDQHILEPTNGAANVALQGSSSQSSLYNFFGESRNAIDGSLSSNYSQIQCSQTAQQLNPWWTVDLKGVFTIFSVAVTNRRDCCWERIKHAEIRIGNFTQWRDNNRCAVIYSLGPGETGSFNCHGMRGRYVSVIITDREDKLSLCEVQVFGLPSSSSGN